MPSKPSPTKVIKLHYQITWLSAYTISKQGCNFCLNLGTRFNNNICLSTFQIISKQIMQIRPSVAEIGNVRGFLQKLRGDPALVEVCDWMNWVFLGLVSSSLHRDFNGPCETTLLLMELSMVSFSLIRFALAALLALPPRLCLSRAA